MTIFHKLIAAFAAAVLLFGAGVLYGAGRVKAEWDKDKAVRAALLEQAEQRAQDVAVSMANEWEGVLNHAKTEAGRTAVNRWLREHGLLPDGTKMRSGGSETSDDRTKVSDATSEEQGVRRSLEEFATNCGLDANALTDWQELCKVQGCEVQ